MTCRSSTTADAMDHSQEDFTSSDPWEVLVVEEEDRQKTKLLRQAEAISVPQMADWQAGLLRDPKNRLAMTAMSSSNPKEVLTTREAGIENQHVFNVKIPFEGGPITNQRSSGRCWLFASTNVFRVAIMQKYGLDAFELSQAYLFFWDKLEKCNYFLEQAMDTAHMDLDSRLVQTLFQQPLSDGGQWDMVRNLVDKYGLVPQSVYPDGYSATNSATLNQMLFTKLREFGLALRGKATPVLALRPSAVARRASLAKADMMKQIHAILVLTLGAPPSPTDPFVWRFVDRAGVAREVATTPQAFSRNIYSSGFRVTQEAIDSMISLVHDPRHEPLTLLTVDRLGNVVGGRGTTYVNVGMDTLKGACIAMLRAGLPVFFGSDVGKFSDRVSGVMDLGLVDYEVGLGVGMLSAHFDKAARLRSGESAMTHAMVLTAVHIDQHTGRSLRWRVQNSWGTEPGEGGWFVMADRWMDEFVYQAVVDPRFLAKEVTDVLQQEPVVLPLWDPMGALA